MDRESDALDSLYRVGALLRGIDEIPWYSCQMQVTDGTPTKHYKITPNRIGLIVGGQIKKLLYMLPNPVRTLRTLPIIPIRRALRNLKRLMNPDLQRLPSRRRRRLLNSQPLLATIRTSRSTPRRLPISLTFNISHHNSQLVRP